MIDGAESFRVEALPNGLIHGKYDGEVVIIPLVKFNELESLAKKSQELTENPSSRFKGKRGDKTGCGHLADAMMIADAVNGASIKEICSRKYPYNSRGSKKVYGRSKVFDALSVNKPGDFQRIIDLIQEYPDILGGIREDVMVWMQRRYKS